MSYISDLRELVGSRPLLTAGATVVVVKDNKILLNLRADTRTWGIPGGALELGETIEEAARRELFEETGLTAAAFTLLNVFSGNDFYFEYPNGDRLHSVIVLLKAENISGELSINDGESIKLAYFSLDEMPELESRAAKVVEWIKENKAAVLP